MVFKNYYKILELETSAVSAEVIKNAYRMVAKKYHPDVNIGDNLAEERIKDINEAYKILSTASTKRKYDRIWNSKFKFGKGQVWSRGEKKPIFNMFFGKENKLKSKSKTIKPIKGENIDTDIDISIEEGFFGVEKKISLKSIEKKSKIYTINIPEGIANGEKIRLIGQGKEGQNGGNSGDLYIKINIKDSKNMKLQNGDLYIDLLLTPWEAALGKRVRINSIDNETIMYIPKGIQTGEKIRIPNKGYKKQNNLRGDLIAEVKIMIPKNITKQEKEIFQKLEKISKFNPRTTS